MKLLTFLMWLVLLAVSWPLALLALVLYPLVWLIGLPLRVVGVSVGGALSVVGAVIRLPARLLQGRSSA